MSSQYKMREFLLNGLISGRFNVDNIAGTFNTAAVCFKTYFIIAFQYLSIYFFLA